MDGDQKLLHVQLFDQLVHDLVQFQQALDDQAVHLGRGVLILVLEEAEENPKHVSVVAVLKHSDHGGVQVFEDQLALLVLAYFVEVLN